MPGTDELQNEWVDGLRVMGMQCLNDGAMPPVEPG